MSEQQDYALVRFDPTSPLAHAVRLPGHPMSGIRTFCGISVGLAPTLRSGWYSDLAILESVVTCRNCQRTIARWRRFGGQP